MAILSFKQILQDNRTTDSNSITSLTLTFKALSDVSCLCDFKYLEKLDLTFNNLTSLEVLKGCVNLKWLSVVQNKLCNLKGIEELTKLTVLNAGKNKLNSIDVVTSVISLRALILNDNEITHVPRLDQMKELNTLVLSRNPIQEIGESMAKLKLISKISLSNCQIQAIGSSFKSCTELKELRLAHNSITSLPGDLACNAKIQILDLGNNSIGRWSDIKVLSSLVNLRKLDLQGNPIVEKEKLAKKIKKLVPSLQTYNAKPIEKIMEYEKDGKIDGSSVGVGNMRAVKKGKHLEQNAVGPSKDFDVDDNEEITVEKKPKVKRKKRDIEFPEKAKKRSTFEDLKQNDNDASEDAYLNPDMKNNSVQQKHESKEIPKTKTVDKMKLRQNPKDMTIDDGEIPFSDFFTGDVAESVHNPNEGIKKLNKGINNVGEVVTFPKNKKKVKKGNVGASAVQSLPPADEIGMGGPSAWN